MNWIDPNKELPPQGKKILYFNRGDIYVVQRFGDLWLPIPFVDSEYAFTQAPELWCDIIPPNGYTGKLHFKIEENENLLDLDELEKNYPDRYHELIEHIKTLWTHGNKPETK